VRLVLDTNAAISGLLWHGNPGKLIDAANAALVMLHTSAPLLVIPPTVMDDPDDDAVLACAVAAEADYIVSADPHLLTLEWFRNIPIVTPRQAVEQLGI
jgi:predicted nucleic acid-binding protein